MAVWIKTGFKYTIKGFDLALGELAVNLSSFSKFCQPIKQVYGRLSGASHFLDGLEGRELYTVGMGWHSEMDPELVDNGWGQIINNSF